MKSMLRAWAKGLLAMFSSRLTGGVLLLILLAFGAHSVFAPGRLPPIGSLGLQQLGLAQAFPVAPSLLDVETSQSVRDSARDAVQSGLPYLEGFLASHPAIIPWINVCAALLAACLLAASMALRMRSPPAPQRGDMTITT